MLTIISKLVKTLVVALLLCNTTQAQFRSYTQVYSQNLKGGIAIFGNTSMHIVDNGLTNLIKMNESANPSNGAGGIGFSNFGNDGENMQPINIDAAIPALNAINYGASWSYKNPSSNQGTAWRTLAAPGAGWTNASASFGYSGNGQTTTIVQNVTHYFLKTINIPTPQLYKDFTFTFDYDDGAVIYVNGIEVKRSNMPAGTVTYNTLATNNGTTYAEGFNIPSSAFVAGNNVIAVEVHQQNATSIDFLFDLSLQGNPYTPSNATSANLILPAGTNTIKFARLYWGGRINQSIVDNVADTLRKINIRKGSSGAYTNVLAAASSVNIYAITSGSYVYQSYIDITSYIQANGQGTYTVADVPCTPGAVDFGGRYGGWCIQIAYENTTLPFTSVRLYDGYSKVYNDGSPSTSTITLSGLNVPNNPLVLSDAVMQTMVWEGDANLAGSASSPAGDYVKLNNILVSNATNPVTNFWNGSISKNGVFVTTKNPSYSNQMGIDIDELQVGTGYGITPNTTTATFEFGTEADQYFPSVFGFAIRMKDPLITLDKNVTDANNNSILENNEVLTYTLSGINNGPGTAYNTFVVDSLPTNVTYVNNSLKIVSAPGIPANSSQTDVAGDDYAFKGINVSRNYVKFYIGNNATSTSGGEIPAGSSYSLQFKVQVPTNPSSVINIARITTNSQAGDVFTDDGTAIIGPSGGPLPVKLISFDATLNNKVAYLKWITENEINNNYFDIERSEDGITFKKIGLVNGNGTTTTTHQYNFEDINLDAASVLYYRLKIVDFDGKISYSKIIVLRIKGTNTLNVFPNPFENNIRITLSSFTNEKVSCSIISFDGKLITTRMIKLTKGENLIILNDVEKIAAGSYILQINTSTENYVQKIIKK